MNRENLTLYLSLTSAVFAGLGFFFSLFTYYRSRSRSITITSGVTQVDSKSVAFIWVRSVGQAPVIVRQVTFSLAVWGDTPHLIVRGPMRALQILEILRNPDLYYPSSDAIISVSPSLPATLAEHQSVMVEIDLDGFMHSFIKRNRGFSSMIEFVLAILFLRVQVFTPTRIYSARTHWAIRYYLWHKYRGSVPESSSQL